MITINQQSLNLGTLPVNKTKEFEVTVTSTEKEEINISISPYCSSCTTGKVLKPNLKHGESTTIKLKFTPTKVGTNHKVVGVNVDGNEKLRINFQAEVI